MTGAVLGGRYELAEQVGVGGYSEVWRATDTALSRPVAVKLLHPGYVRQGRALARFRDEARHAGALSHQNIARIYDYGEQPDGQSPYLVMELVEGPSLADVLAGGALGTPRSMDIVAQAAAGLQAAHAEGLVHRDVKPANMLLAPGGTVKITDFGIAHAIGAVPVTATGELLGTPGYLAPECVTGQQATEASDLYALGIVAYECLAGEPPFAGTALVIALAHRDRPLPPLPQSVPADVCALVMQLTAKDPAWRPGSAAEVALRAGRLRDGQGDRDARSGFLYYVSTALSSLIIPLPAITMAWFFPQWVRPWNTIWLAGALALWLVVYPLVMRGRWRIEVLRVQTVYGFAHAFNIVHLLRNRVAEWHPTSSKAPAPIAVKVKRFYTVYLGLALSAVAVGLIMRTAEDGLTLFAGMLVFFVLNLYVVGPLVVSGIGDEPRSRRQRPVSPKPRPEDFADSSCLLHSPTHLVSYRSPVSSYPAQHRRLACEEDVMDTMTLPAIPVILDEIPATAAKPAHRRPQDRGLLHRFLVFGSVGAFVFVVGTALQWVLLKPLGADYSYIWQTIFSVELSYVLNRWLTWHDRDVSVISSLVKWNAQKLVLTVPNIVCYDLLLGAGMNWLVSNLAATAAFTVMNYVAADKWTFIRQYRRVNAYGEATGCITGSLQPGNRVQFRRVMSRGQQVILGLFLTVMVVSGGGLLVLLAATAHVTSIVTGSVLVLMLGVEALRISVGIPVALFACRARDPIPLLPNGQLPRVALLTTVVPGKEPIEMVRHTLLAMLAVRYPGVKDVWLLDEGNHPDFRALCEELGVRHFSRKGRAELNQEGEAHTPYRAKTKAGNHNAWRSRYENEYDLVGQSDPDHVPKPWFLERTVGYFNDPDVGFVVAPQIYGNSDKNWIARGAAQAAYIFEAIVQRGANGLGAPILIGTNHMYRTECWRQIGGYQDSLIEDHVTALAVFAQTNPATVNRWRGVYTPDILSVGEGPATFTDWFNQQMRWSFGMWNVVAEWSPKFLLKLRWRQTVSFLLLQPYYLIAAFQWMLSIALITVYMVTGTDLGIPMEWWAVLWGTSMFSGLVFFFWTARFRLTADQRRETGLTGIALMLMTLPIYAASGVRWLMGCGLPYVITAKGDMQSPDSMRTFQPHLVVLTLTVYLLVLSAGGMIHSWPIVLFWAWFATAVCAVPIIVHLVGKVGRCLKRLA